MTQPEALLKYSVSRKVLFSSTDKPWNTWKYNLTPYCEGFDLFAVVHHCFCVPKYKVRDSYNDEFVKMTFHKKITFIFQCI